jgi:predicted DNA-binding transcriptional regulator YafY
MKLYNLFEEIILEEIERNRNILTEGVFFDDAKAAIDGKYNVNILYRDYEDQPPSKRYIQVYNLSKTKSGNDAIRAYQIIGASKRGNKNGYWKIFRLDRIEGWFPTKVKWAKPVSDFDSSIARYNKDGDNSFTQVLSKANITQTPQQIKQTV